VNTPWKWAQARGLQAQRLSLPGYTLDLELRPYTLNLLRDDARRAPVAYGPFAFDMSGEPAMQDPDTVDRVLN